MKNQTAVKTITVINDSTEKKVELTLVIKTNSFGEKRAVWMRHNKAVFPTFYKGIVVVACMGRKYRTTTYYVPKQYFHIETYQNDITFNTFAYYNSCRFIANLDKRYSNKSQKRTALHTIVCLDIDNPQLRETIRQTYDINTICEKFDQLCK